MAATAQCGTGTPGGPARKNSITNFFSPQQTIKPREASASQAGILGFFKKLPATPSVKALETPDPEGTENQAPPSLDDSLTDFEIEAETPKIIKAKKEVKSRSKRSKKTGYGSKRTSAKKVMDKKLSKVEQKGTAVIAAPEETENSVTEISYEEFLVASQMKGEVKTTAVIAAPEEAEKSVSEISYEEFLVSSQIKGVVETKAVIAAPEEAEDSVSEISYEDFLATSQLTGVGEATEALEPMAESVIDSDEESEKVRPGAEEKVQTDDEAEDVVSARSVVEEEGSKESTKPVPKKVKATKKASQEVDEKPASVREPKPAVNTMPRKTCGKTSNKVNPFQSMMAQRSHQKPPPIALDADEDDTQPYEELAPVAPVEEKSDQGPAITNFFSFTAKKPAVSEKKEFVTLDIEAEVYGSPKKKGASRRPSMATSPESLKLAEIKCKSNVVVDCTVEDVAIVDLGSAPITPKKTRKIVKTAAIFDIAKRKINLEPKPDPGKQSPAPKAVHTQSKDASVEVKQKVPETASKEGGKDVTVKKKSKDVKKQAEETSTMESQTAQDQQKAQHEQQRAVNVAKMAALDHVNIPKKATAQATLSFTGKLVKAATPVQDKFSEAKSPNAETLSKSKATVKSTKLAKNKRGKPAIVNPVTPVKGRSGSKRKRSSDVDKDPESSPIDVDAVPTPKKRVLRGVYKITPIKPQRKSQRGLKMTFTRICDMPDEDKEKHLKKKAKADVARQLIHKAKSKAKSKVKPGSAKKKKKLSPRSKTRQKSASQSSCGSSSSVEDCTPLRRSSRASSQIAKMAISECLEPPVKDSTMKSRHKSSEDFSNSLTATQSPKKAKRGSVKAGTPNKASKKTPQKVGKKSVTKEDGRPTKKGVKLASIFMKSKVSSKDDDDDVQLLAVEIDPELARVRREFLLSGVPDTLRRQQSITCVQAAVGDYSPLPEVSHVQQPGCCDQAEDAIDPWVLADVTLPLRSEPEQKSPWEQATPLGLFTCCDKSTLKADVKPCINVELPDQTPPVDWPAEVERYLLAEVHRYNPTFPVRRVYKQLHAKLDDKLEEKLAEKLPEEAAEEKLGTKEPSSGKQSRKRKFGSDEEIGPLRRSKRRRESAEVIILDGSPSFSSETAGIESTSGNSMPADSKEEECTAPELQWTEKYAPSCHNEVLGNSKLVSRLRGWLSDWKQQTDLEARRMKKLLLKQAKRQNKSKEEVKKDLGEDWWIDSDSDFEVGSSDSEEENDNRLCNTMLVTGPHGAGKTAMVYALAQELGYKVFEVNAASRRAGRQILTQLQEATQSHQVARSALDSMFTTFMMTENCGEDKKEKEKNKMPTSFTNFFKKGEMSSETKDKKSNPKEQKEKKNKPKSQAKPGIVKKAVPVAATKALPPGVMDSPRRGLQLSSTSLILFEEVDVVFEEDKGFWAAIQTFMGSTKRPIILTASNPQLASQISGRVEQLKIRRPPATNVASYLQLVCMAEKKRASFADLLALVAHNRGDLRSSLLSLQWWLLSGADTKPVQQDLVYSKKFFENKPTETSKSVVTPSKNMKPASFTEDSADDFQIAKRPARRRAQVLRDDESSRDDTLSSPQRLCPLPAISEDSQDSPAVDEDSQMGLASQGNMDTVASELERASVSAPLLHQGCLESVTGCPHNKAHHSSILQCLSHQPSSSVLQSCCLAVLSHHSSHHTGALYAHLPHQLCLPLVQFTPSPRLPLAQLPQDTPASSKHRRIKNVDDLYDSEQSDDEATSAPAAECAQTDPTPPDPSAPVPPPTATQRLSHAAVSSLAELYDMISFTDSYLSPVMPPCREGQCTSDQCRGCRSRSAGLSLELPTVEDPSWQRDQLVEEINTTCHLQSVVRTNQRLGKIMQAADNLTCNDGLLIKQCLSVPVGLEDIQPTGVRTQQESNQLLSMCSNNQRALEGVKSALPGFLSCEHRAVATDYMPYIRAICQSEQLRRVNNTKRRFFHHCDQISLNVTKKPAVLETLNWSFH